MVVAQKFIFFNTTFVMHTSGTATLNIINNTSNSSTTQVIVVVPETDAGVFDSCPMSIAFSTFFRSMENSPNL